MRLAFVLLALAALGRTEQDAAGLSLKTGAGLLRLEVYSPSVIRVRQVPGGELPRIESLAVLAKPGSTPFSVSQSAKEASLLTSELRASVDLETGSLAFYNIRGELLLSAQAPKIAAPRAEASFVMQPGEAYYGLGQHQDGLMDYRGHKVNLLQENTKVAVPVLVSSKGWGLLWDNPSAGEVSFGASGGGSIPKENLLNDQGKPGGLTGRYFKGMAFENLAFTRVDPSVNFDWYGSKPEGLPSEFFSVRWTGFVLPDESGEHTFLATADDGVRLWVDKKLVVDDWKARAAMTFSATVKLQKGKKVPIKMEYYQDKMGAEARLAWKGPSREGAPLRWLSEQADGGLDYYFMAGPGIPSVIRSYRALTGQAPMLPKWAWGFWQSKERYNSQKELLDVVDRHRREKVPIDGIVQDWRYWDPKPWGSHHLDPARFPDPSGLMKELHKKNVHMIISVWPRFDPGSANADELGKAGVLYAKPVEYEDGKLKSHWYDAFSAKGRQLYWAQISRQLFKHKIDGWWLDASEPEIPAYHDYQTALGPAQKVRNAYPLVHTGGVYQGQRAEAPDQRVFILTRSAYTGQQRHSAVTWSGDIQGNWDVYAKQIPAGLHFSMSGIPYWNTDIGGFFSGDPANPDYAELFTRWFQFGAFNPMFRVHGTSHPKEFWRFDPATQEILARYIRLRYRLLPYIYSVSWQVCKAGDSMLRSLAMDFPKDEKALQVGDQFLFGPALMVAPVTQAKAQAREVLLPQGAAWHDFWTGKVLSSGTIQAEAPIGTLPLYVRAGTILTLGPEVQHTAEAADPIEIRVYPGADGGFELYEDDGVSNAYEKGGYAVIPLSWNDAARRLTIGARQGAFKGMLKKRSFRVHLASERSDKVVEYQGGELALSLEK